MDVFLHENHVDRRSLRRICRGDLLRVRYGRVLLHNEDIALKNIKRYDRAGFRIGQGVMVVGKIIAAACGYGGKFMIRERTSELFPRCDAGAVELIIRIWHAETLVSAPQTSFVENAPMGYER